MDTGVSVNSDDKWLEGHTALGELVWLIEFPAQAPLPRDKPLCCHELIPHPSAPKHAVLSYKAPHSHFTSYRDERIQWVAYTGCKWRLSSEEKVSEVALKPKAGDSGEGTMCLSGAVGGFVPRCLPVPWVPTSTWNGEKNACLGQLSIFRCPGKGLYPFWVALETHSCLCNII